jgi:hypothetical protein
MSTDKRFAKQTLEGLALHHKDKVNLILSDIPTSKSGKRYGYGYGYGYGKHSKKKHYGFDYIRTRLSKKSEDSAYKYIDDDEEV